MKLIILLMLLTLSSYSAEWGIFPTPTQINLAPDVYRQLLAVLGIVSGYLFWGKIFR